MPRRGLRYLPAIAALCWLLLVSAITLAEEGGSDLPPSSEVVFDELYSRLPEAGEPAEELRFRLRADLIRRDAEIEILKLETARVTGERQAQVLDRLVRAAAARERSLWLAIRQLERLAGEPPVPVPVAEPPAEEEASGGSSAISFEPRDVIEDPDP